MCSRVVYIEAQFGNFTQAMFFIPRLVLNDHSIKQKVFKKLDFLYLWNIFFEILKKLQVPGNLELTQGAKFPKEVSSLPTGGLHS